MPKTTRAVRRRVTGTKRAGARKSSSRSLSAGICRVDQPSTRTHGFVVRVDYRRTPKGWRPRHTAFFGDVRHGGKSKALSAAEGWLKTLRRTGKAPRKRA